MYTSRVSTKGVSPFTKKNDVSKKQNGIFSEVLNEKLEKVVSSDIDSIIKEISSLDEEIEKGFKDEYIEKYKEILRKLILKTQEVVKTVEKISGKNKDKILKVVVVSDQKLKQLLDELIASEVSKLKIKGVIKELYGILVSLQV